MTARSRGDKPTQVALVYEQPSTDEAEPLVAVFGSEDEARRLCDARQSSGRKTSWEPHELVGPAGADPVPVTDGLVVHIVSLGGLADRPEDSTDLDPIGLGVFVDRVDAERFAAEQVALLGDDNVRVRTLPLGWTS